MADTKIEDALNGLDEYLVQAYNEQPLPGLAVGVVQDGKLVYTRNFGYSDLERQTPVSSETVFRIMSISKTFTAIGIMQLWEAGKLGLDDPVNPYLKAMRVEHKDPAAPQITFRHLLTHTAGIGEVRDLSDTFRPVGGLGAKPGTRILSMPEYYDGKLQAEIYPGQKWAYANHGYAVLAQLIEDISGEPFAEYMRRHVFKPLGMDHSDYYLSERVRDALAQGNLTQGYQFKRNHFEPVPYLRLNTPGCGGIFSNVNDMARYMSALMNGGQAGKERILKAESLKEMMSSQLETDPRVFEMGLGFVLTHIGPYAAVRHGGGWPGFISEMTVAPDQKLGVVVFTNSSSRAPGLIARGILQRLLDVKDPLEALPDPTILEKPANWSCLCGSYSPRPGFLTNWRVWEGYGGEIKVYVKDNHLMACGLVGPTRKGFPLYRAESDDELLFMWKTGKQLTPILFEAGADGQVKRMNLGQFVMIKRLFTQSLRFKALSVMGILGGTLFGFLTQWLFKKKKK